MEERAQYSDYVVIPTKFNFKRSFRVTMMVIKFISLCRRGKAFEGPKLANPGENVPTIFHSVCSINLLLNQDMLNAQSG